MFLFFEGFQSQNVVILFLFFIKHFYRLGVKITPDVNNSFKLGNILILVLSIKLYIFPWNIDYITKYDFDHAQVILLQVNS